MKNFYKINEIIEEKKINKEPQVRDIIAAFTLESMVKRIFHLTMQMSDNEFDNYIALQKKSIKAKDDGQNDNYELAEMFFDLLERKRKECKSLRKH